jgi:hypothetical protein
MKVRIPNTTNQKNKIYRQLPTGEKIEIVKDNTIYYLRVTRNNDVLLKYPVGITKIEKEFRAVESVL